MTWIRSFLYEIDDLGKKFRCPVCHQALNPDTDIIKLPNYKYLYDCTGHLVCPLETCRLQLLLLGWSQDGL